jgi:hypothetical protein
MIRRHCLPFSCETRLYFSPSCIPSLLCATAWHPPCTKAKGNRVWQTECLETFHPLNITSRTCESMPPLYFEMSALFRPMGPRIARQNQLQPGALQRTAFSSRLQSRRSMATNKGNLKDDEELNAMMRIPARRSFFLDSKTGRAIATRAEQFRTMQHEQLWEKVKRAEKQLSISMTDVPRRKRALERIYADLVATNARNLTLSIGCFRKLAAATDQREMVSLMEQEVERQQAYHEAKWRSVKLYLFAPPGDVSFFRRLGKLLGYVGTFPMFLYDKVAAVGTFLCRKRHNRQLELFARKRPTKSIAEDKNKSRDAGTKQHPAKSSKIDSRRPRRK